MRSAPSANPSPPRAMPGSRPSRIIIAGDADFGALAGLMAINNVMGEAERLI